MSTGWLKTLDGQDTYTEDGEWYWFPRIQQWVHDPALLAMPPSPTGVAIRNEAYRLSHGWPGLRGAFRLRNGVRGSDWLVGMAIRAYFVYCIGWLALHFVPFVNAIKISVVSLFDPSQEAAYNALPHGEQGWLFFGGLAFVWALCCLYILYMIYVNTIDPHKAALMLGAILVHSAATTYKHRARQTRIAEMTEAIRNAQPRR
jgi:hypothetical protein